MLANTAWADCPIKVEGGAQGKHGYKERDPGKRCEGLLPLFVSGNTNIQLIGFEADDLVIDPGITSISLKALAPDKTNLHIRAVASNPQSRYRMDTPSLASSSLIFDWRLDVLQAQDLGIERNSLGLLACTNKCLNNPNTIYFPVMMVSQASKKRQLSVLLRSEVTAGQIMAALREQKSEAAVKIPVPSHLRLTPERVVRLTIPGLNQGYYRLTVSARTVGTDEPMGALQALLYMPGDVK